MFMGKSSTDSPQDIGPKDLMVVLLSDLKSSVTSTKPSSYTISSLLTGGHNRSLEESKMNWALEADHALRFNLAVFFVYFFADLEEYMTSAAVTGGVHTGFGTLSKGADHASRRMSSMGSAGPDGSSNPEVRTFAPEDSRSQFDLKTFLLKRNQMGDSRQLLMFLQDFVNSQIFERYCGELIIKKQSQAARLAELKKRNSVAAPVASALSNPAAHRSSVHSMPSALTPSAVDDDIPENDLYERAVREWNQRALPLTISNVKAALTAVSPVGAGKGMSSYFHNLTVQFTSSATPLAQCELDIDRDNQYYTSYLGNSNLSSADSSANR